MILPFVETMITQACNISCTGCTNYSDLKHSGYVTWDQGREQLVPWLERVHIPDFGIFGGEPLINPEVREWIWGVRGIMPQSQIRFTTNGLLLDRNFDIVDLMAEIGNCVLKITVHVNSTDLENTINSVMKRYTWEPIREYGIDRYVTENGFKFQVNRPQTFVKTFRGQYSNMSPYDNLPQSAFENCCQQTCPLLYQGRLFKCSTSGLLDDVLSKFNYPNHDSWAPYIQDGLESNCSDQDLIDFIDNFGQPNSMCRMCPSKADSAEVLHFDNVSTRKLSWLTNNTSHAIIKHD